MTSALRPADRCPGLLRPHLAADGAVVRVRLPGGRLRSAQLAALVDAAESFGDGTLQLTSRANVQLRGIRLVRSDAENSSRPEPNPADRPGSDPVVTTFQHFRPEPAVDPGLQQAVLATGLLPSASHERVRNFLCSPLTGLTGGLADLRPVLPELDRMVCEAMDLADLSGRFLFGLDDGRGDIAALSPDLGARAVDAERAVIVAGAFAGQVLGLDRVPSELVRLARAFLASARGAWRVADTTDGGAALLVNPTRRPDRRAGSVPLGTIRSKDGRWIVSAIPPLGLMDHRRVEPLLAAGPETVIVTPDRGVVLTGLSRPVAGRLLHELRQAGWVTDPRSGWFGISACTGAPGCRSSHGDTRAVAAELAAGQPGRVHVVGCERRCGAPAGPHTELLLTDSGAVRREVDR